MTTRRVARIAALAGAGLLLIGTVGVTSAANPNAAYHFDACWDDGTVTTIEGVRGRQSWSAIRVNAVSVAFENYQFAADYYTISGTRSGSEISGWFTPQVEGGGLVLSLYNGRRVVATGTVPEPAGGWSTLDPCPVD